MRAYTEKVLEPAADPTEFFSTWQMHEKDVERARQLVASAESVAEVEYDFYLKCWDFFKAMGMLPLHPTQGDAWKNPNAFREWLANPGNNAPLTATLPPQQTEDAELKPSTTSPLAHNCEDYI